MARIATLTQEPARQELRLVDFDAAVRDHQSMVFSLAYHFLRDPALAEELAQDVFLELHVHWDEIRSAGHLVFWLRKVASRKCVDQARRRKFRTHATLEQVPEPFAWMPEADPLLKQYLEQLLATLLDTPRLIVILRFQEDLEPAEISQVLDMPVATVKSHLQRSLALLRRKFLAATGGDMP